MLYVICYTLYVICYMLLVTIILNAIGFLCVVCCQVWGVCASGLRRLQGVSDLVVDFLYVPMFHIRRYRGHRMRARALNH